MATVPVQPAATVMMIRDGLDGGGPSVEVCMLRRNLASEFVAGAYVFPGGSVDPDDHAPEVEAHCQGRTDAEASAVLGVESGGLSYWVAALRECFEEAGVLVARRRGSGGRPGAFLDTSDGDTSSRFAAYRDAVNGNRMGLLDICRQEDLVLAVDSLFYVSHWITPELAPRRYDTRFFITAAPLGQIARHDDGETIASIWVRPQDALARYAAGEIELLPPTIANLRNIEGFVTTAEVMAWASQVTEVVTVLPIVLIEDGHVLILRPGDPGYVEALADRQASGAPLDPALVEVARQTWGPRAGTA